MLTGLSLAGPLTAGATMGSAKVTLVGEHLVAAAIVIPLISARLASLSSRRGR